MASRRLSRFVEPPIAIRLYADTVIEEADDRLFNSRPIVFYEQHLLHRLLPERHYTNYNLRSRRHDRTLLANTDRRNFVHRMIFKDMY